MCKYLTVLLAAALVVVVVLLQQPAKAQDCPDCKRQAPPFIGVVTTQPRFATPIRTGIHYLLTPRGYYEIRWYVPSGRYQVLGVVPPPTIVQPAR